MKQIYALTLLLIVISVLGCMEKKTEDPVKAYTYWAGERPTNEIELFHGRYWKSAHWSYEYILYLELRASPKWENAFLKQNHLTRVGDSVEINGDAPIWFRPPSNSCVFKPTDSAEGAVVYVDTVQHKMYLYFIQL
jgi:hypothetical protein